MSNIRIIKTGINISKILAQLKQYPEDWNSQKDLPKSESLVKKGFDDLPIDVLQLVIGAVNHSNDFVFNSNLCVKTPAYTKHTEIVDFLKRHYDDRVQRCGFLCLPIGAEVGVHVDEGSYYLTRDRYHLSIQGIYNYYVGDESITVHPGTLFWFNNKKKHRAVNVGSVPRITFVFDLLHHKDNP
jgi:mannose-6-phosphate isomerase-like protein (cupin superfamily)